jgi:hypothetical protein
VGDVVYELMRLRTAHNMTYSAIDEVQRIINASVLPAGAQKLPHMTLVREFFEAQAARDVGPFQVERVDLCVNGCLAFKNLPRSERAEQANAGEATRCPICHEKRFFDASGRCPRAVRSASATAPGVALRH